MASSAARLAAATSASDSDRHGPASSTLQCCCGRLDCLVLKKNSSVLESVEKDVHTAAQLGQALLVRHEAYMADAERDRLNLTARIERLEMDKLELEAENAAKIEENRHLLDQLESLNNNVMESDTKIRSLEATLLSSMQNVRRLESSAARAADAERHLAALEEEQEKLHRELRITREDARSHSQRFKEAQRGILDMQDQLERIEKEAKEERDRHEEVIARMERQREVDKQLDIAAGRLKGAAASKTLQADTKTGNSKIIGHFVRDLLQDNATLQLGIAELRELLMNSNDEIQSLREQLICHQPLDDSFNSPASTLKAELESQAGNDTPAGTTGPSVSQELHIHHHYHVAQGKELKRPKKKRQGLLPGIFTPPATLSSPSSPHSSGQWGLPSSPTAPALMSNETVDPTPTTSRTRPNWTGYSNPPSEISSSMPSSPNLRATSSVFDHSFGDLSDPVTSPSTSFDPMSPTWRASHTKRTSFASTRSFQSLSCLESEPDLPQPQSQAAHRNRDSVILEEDESRDTTDDEASSIVQASTSDAPAEDDDFFDEFASSPRRPLRRTASHESIMSLSGGLDIHTLKIRPSQMTLRPLGGADAVVTGVVAQPTLSRTTAKRSDAALRDQFMNFHPPRHVSSPLSQAMSQSPGASSSGLRSWVGWRPWGAMSHQTPAEAASKPTEKGKEKDFGRSPGINQAGAIPGFQEYWASQKRKGAPAKVTTETVDRDALIEGLRD